MSLRKVKRMQRFLQGWSTGRRSRALALALAGMLTAAWVRAQPAPEASAKPEADFMAENDAAMMRMMSAMTIRPTGDVDHDFVLMMVPHHQGAIDMARAELRYGHNEQLKRLAQGILVTQTDEIRVMRLAVGVH